MEKKQIPITAIVPDGGTQTRVENCPETVDRYVRVLEAGGKLPAIKVYSDGKRYWPGDGFHRVEAHVTFGSETIEAEVRAGGRAAALQCALGANERHGLPRTPADRRNCVAIALREFPTRSAAAIAKLCKVSATLVAAVKAEAPADDESPAPVVIASDGKSRLANRPASSPEGVLTGPEAVEAACLPGSLYIRLADPVPLNYLKAGVGTPPDTWAELLSGKGAPVVQAMIPSDAEVPPGRENDLGQVVELVLYTLAVAACPDTLRAKPLSSEHHDRELKKADAATRHEAAVAALHRFFDRRALARPLAPLPEMRGLVKLALRQASPGAVDFAKRFHGAHSAGELLNMIDAMVEREPLVDMLLLVFTAGELRNLPLADCEILNYAAAMYGLEA